MRKKAKTTHKKQIGMLEEAPTTTKEQPQPLTVRVGKRPINKPIGDWWPNQRIRVSRHVESPSMSKNNKEAVE